MKERKNGDKMKTSIRKKEIDKQVLERKKMEIK
jgi:hypothetical protein